MTAPTGHGCTIEGVPRVQAADRPARRARRPRRRAQRPPAVLQNDRLPIGRIDSAPSCRRAVPAPCAVRRDACMELTPSMTPEQTLEPGRRKEGGDVQSYAETLQSRRFALTGRRPEPRIRESSPDGVSLSRFTPNSRTRGELM